MSQTNTNHRPVQLPITMYNGAKYKFSADELTSTSKNVRLGQEFYSDMVKNSPMSSEVVPTAIQFSYGAVKIRYLLTAFFRVHFVYTFTKKAEFEFQLQR